MRKYPGAIFSKCEYTTRSEEIQLYFNQLFIKEPIQFLKDTRIFAFKSHPKYLSQIQSGMVCNQREHAQILIKWE
jgi:hypothetical protein